jgi:hypothetical protein
MSQNRSLYIEAWIIGIGLLASYINAFRVLFM